VVVGFTGGVRGEKRRRRRRREEKLEAE